MQPKAVMLPLENLEFIPILVAKYKKARERYKIEAKCGMQMQWALTIFAVNLKRILMLTK